MIPHERFGSLRLSDFVPRDEAQELGNWEFLDHIWIGEALGFSEWLRLEADPDVLRSLAIDFSSFPGQAAESVLNTIGLELRGGMMLTEIKETLGEPDSTETHAQDRTTCRFTVVDGDSYDVSCTVSHTEGLRYLVVTTPLLPARD